MDRTPRTRENEDQTFDLTLLHKEQPNLVITQLDNNSRDADAINADAAIINFNLVGLCLAWKAPRLTIKSACELAKTTAQLLTVRRRLLNKQYGDKSDKNNGSGFTPLD